MKNNSKRKDSVVVDTKIHKNNIESRDMPGARSCSWVHVWAKQWQLNEQEGTKDSDVTTESKGERNGGTG